MNILLAEDEKYTAEIMSQILQRLGHNITKVSSGIDMLNQCQRGKIDLILTDINIKELSGSTATRIIHHYINKTIPIYAITGLDPKEIPKGIFTNIFHKPINLGSLINTINSLKKEQNHERRNYYHEQKRTR